MMLKDRLKQARKAAGKTQLQVAEAVRMRQSSYSELETGKSNASTLLPSIANVLGVDAFWLQTGKNQKPYIVEKNKELNPLESPTKQYSLLAHDMLTVDVWDEETPLDDDEIEVPYLKEVSFSAGNGRTSEVIERYTKKLRFSKQTLKNLGVDPAYVACGKNSGNSMGDRIGDGATLGIDRSKQQIKDGKIYAFDHGGMLRVKYLHRLPDGGIRVRSHNSDEYADEMISAQDWQENVRLLGWVFWWSTLEKW